MCTISGGFYFIFPLGKTTCALKNKTALDKLSIGQNIHWMKHLLDKSSIKQIIPQVSWNCCVPSGPLGFPSGHSYLSSQHLLGTETPMLGRFLHPQGILLQGCKHSTGMNPSVFGTRGKGLQRKTQKKEIPAGLLCWKCCSSLTSACPCP